jgi:hypothetical protein
VEAERISKFQCYFVPEEISLIEPPSPRRPDMPPARPPDDARGASRRIVRSRLSWIASPGGALRGGQFLADQSISARPLASADQNHEGDEGEHNRTSDDRVN